MSIDHAENRDPTPAPRGHDATDTAFWVAIGLCALAIVALAVWGFA